MRAKDVKRGTKVQVNARDGETVVGDGEVVAVRRYDASGLVTIDYEVTVRRSFGPFQPFDQARGETAEALD